MTETEKTTQKEHPDLYKRSIKGGFWVFALKFATQAMGFVKSIIVFNFLFNENLELIVIANMLMAVLTTFSESGFHAALVQKKENIDDYLDTAWVIGIIRGLVLFAVMFLAAPLFASIKADPETVDLAVSVIRVMAFCFLIRSFQNIGIVYFQKEMQFHKTFWLTMAGTITDIVMSITFVVLYKSVWGYVAARLAASVVNLAMSYLMCAYRPKFHFVGEKAKELWQFGKWLCGGNIIGYLLNEGDDWFVLAYLGPNALKLYRYAYRFAHMPATHITYIISQITFPAYSKIQQDIPRLRQSYLKALSLTSFLSIPTGFLVFSLGPDFVTLFLVEEAHSMSLLFQILAFKGVLASLGATWSPLYRALGKPKYSVHLMFFCLITLSLTIYPFTKYWGIEGTALATILAGLLNYPYGLAKAAKSLNCSIWQMLRIFIFPIVASIIMSALILVIKLIPGLSVNIPIFIGLVVTALFTYLSCSWLMGHVSNSGFNELFREQIAFVMSKTTWCKSKKNGQ